MSQLESSTPQLLNKDYICKCKLVYNNALATNTIENILLISSCVTESQLFYNSANNNTFPIIYSPNSEKNELIELLRNKFKNGLKRITFAFHDPLNDIKTFLDEKPFFNETDLIANQTAFSENVTFLTNLIKEFKIKNCDFLACDSLKYSNWKKYYEVLNKLTNVICGASNDKTGNIKYGANWIMENTNENIRDIYFTTSINNYASSLAAFTIDYVNYSTSGNNATIVGASSPPSNWNLTIPSTVTNGGITYNVTEIGGFSLYSKQTLISVIIPDSIITINQFAFYASINLATITVNGNNQYYSDINGILFNKNKTSLFQYPPGKNNTSYTIPNSVINILSFSFYYCRILISVIIPDTVTTIGDSGFQECQSLTSVIIPDSVTTINPYAFSNCTNLTSFTTGSGLQIVKQGLFRDCSSLTSIIIGTSVLTIDNDAFQGCSNLRSVTFLGTTIPSIGTNNFTISNDTAYYYSGTTNTSALSIFTNTVVTTRPLPANICFLKETPVRTDQGLIHIDKINPDLHTIRNKKIVAITKTITRDKYLVCFEKDSLGPKMPSEKTIITYNHKILYNGKMIKAKHFIENFENVHDVKYNGELLYNVLLEEPSKMIVNNLICETLHPDNLIAQIYRFLPNMNLKEQDELITRVNKDAVFAFNN